MGHFRPNAGDLDELQEGFLGVPIQESMQGNGILREVHIGEDAGVLPGVQTAQVGGGHAHFVAHSPNINQCGIGFDRFNPPGQHADHTGTPSGLQDSRLEQLFESILHSSVVVDAAARGVLCGLSPLALRGGQMLFAFAALQCACRAQRMAKAKASAASAGVGILVRFKIRVTIRST